MSEQGGWMTSEEAASYLRIAPKTLRVWRYRGVGPRYSRLAGPYSPVRYHIDDLEAWLRERRHASTSDESARRLDSADDGQCERDTGVEGMELRDYFAAKAMAAIVANPEWTVERTGETVETNEQLAEAAYEIADAMVVEREREEGR